MPESSVPVPGSGAFPVDAFLNGTKYRQRVIAGDRGGYTGRVGTFRTPGRNAASAHRLLAMLNAAGSTVVVDVHQVTIDLYQTVIKAITVPPPIIRIQRITAITASTGNALTKVAEDTSLTSNTSVTVFGDASADGTASTTALGVTAVTGFVTQEFAPRLITGAGYEMADRLEFLSAGQLTLRAGEGFVLSVDATVGATSEPTSDMWIATARWEEYTP